MGLVALPLEWSKISLLQLRLDNRTPVKQELRDLITPHIQNTEIPNFLGLKIIEDLTQTLLDFRQSTPNLRSLANPHNPYGAVPPPLPRPPLLGHPFGPFEGELLS